MNMFQMRTTPERLAREQRRPENGEAEYRIAAHDEAWVNSDGERENRATEDGESRIISGYGAVFNQLARVWDFDEVLRRDAFTKTLKDGGDKFVYWVHQEWTPMASIQSGTVRFSVDDYGLRYEADVGRSGLDDFFFDKIARGIVRKSSFGFQVVQQQWTERDENVDLREIQEVKLFETSPVPFPAYAGTSVGPGRVQSATPNEPEPGRMAHSTQFAKRRQRLAGIKMRIGVAKCRLP